MLLLPTLPFEARAKPLPFKGPSVRRGVSFSSRYMNRMHEYVGAAFRVGSAINYSLFIVSRLLVGLQRMAGTYVCTPPMQRWPIQAADNLFFHTYLEYNSDG
jgi:hypothetical protein